jgi:hypothetical protein
VDVTLYKVKNGLQQKVNSFALNAPANECVAQSLNISLQPDEVLIAELESPVNDCRAFYKHEDLNLQKVENSVEYSVENGQVVTETNHAGGILGGITNGMPVVFRTAFKPTPSIAKEQKSVDLAQGTDTVLRIQGRHDPCIVQRAVPVVEAAAAIAVYDAYLSRKMEV